MLVRDRSILQRAPDLKIISRCGDHLVQAAQVPGVFSSALGDIGYIFRAPDMATIDEIVDFIHKLK